ncbi:LUD domain-containing protein [Halarchaeum nitratireducens]|uniref:Lactate utilization protein C n=1 Tax=Halarchaeum nitratireducens TaxID=489913 RepID=A0A830GGH7_9EURY|nr:LUD domain-containing protein [Halarchaeum nitratireducens]GGN24714.1 lactate utilization protein C [Halarchaeum nitratireducens]
MPQALTSEFRDSLAAHSATSSVVETAALSDALAERLDGPAVATPLPFAGASLDDLPVTLDPTPAELEAAEFGVTAAEFAIADYGSVVLRMDTAGTEPVSLFPETHVAVVAQSDIEPDAEAAFEALDGAVNTARASAVIATGPSATADMGGLVYGAHGPRNVHVVVLSDR